MPRVSVVMPTYNRAHGVARALESVFAQAYADREVIVVDDGSTDDTPAVLASFGDRIRAIRTANAGCTAARNVALAAARGEFVAFLDDDDSWHPEKLAAQVAAFDRFGDGAGMCFTDAAISGDPSRTRSFFQECGYDPGAEVALVDDAMSVAMLPKQPMLIPTVMVRRTALDGVGRFDPELRVSQDTDVLFKLALTTRFCVVNRVLATIDVSPSRAVSVDKLKKRDPMIKLRAQERLYGNFLRAIDGRYPDAAREVRSRLEGALSRGGVVLAGRGETALARDYFRRAFSYKASGKGLVKLCLAYAWPGLLVSLSGRRDALRNRLPGVDA